MNTHAPADPSLTRARAATLFIFFAAGFALGTWLTLIPAVKDRLDLTEGQVGNALFSSPLIMMVVLPFVGTFIERYGSHRVTQVGGILFCISLLMIGLAPTYFLLIVALLLLGASNAFFNTGINTQAVVVEDALNRSVLNGFYALFSVGMLTAAGLTALLTLVGVSATLHLIAVGMLMGTGMFLSGFWMFSGDKGVRSKREDTQSVPFFVLPGKALLILGILGLCNSFAESAIGNWSTLYLRDTVKTGEALAPMGFFLFFGTHALGRMGGDHLQKRFGAVRLLQISLLVSLSGIGLAIILPEPVPAFLGLGIAGGGFAVMFPLIYSAAGRTPGYSSGRAIAGVNTLTQFGFLFGPLIMGQVADVYSLRTAMILPIVMLVIMLFFTDEVRRADARREGPAPDEPLPLSQVI